MVSEGALPAADPNEYKYWTDPILCEDTRAGLEYFRQLEWLPPNYKPKAPKGIAVMEGTGTGRSIFTCSHEWILISLIGLQVLRAFEGRLCRTSTYRGSRGLYELL
jgi:hypothetical protein